MRLRIWSFLLPAAFLLGAAVVPPSLQAQETHVLIVAGLGGEPRFQEQFVEWGSRMAEGAHLAGVPEERVTFLAEDTQGSPGTVDGRSTREEVEAAFRRIAEVSSPNDRVLILLIGHGSGSGPDSLVNLPGPSLRAAEYEALIEGLAPRQVAVVNVASASGDFVPVLVGDGRIVITATRSSAQRNATVFGGHFISAFLEESADADRDGRISLLEAFEYARIETERHFRERNLLPSETALLEDRPDGSGVTEPGGEGEVGLLASRFFLEGPRRTDDPDIDPRLVELLAEEERLEQEVRELLQQVDALDEDEYRSRLEALLTELARVGQEIRQVEGDPE